MAGEVAHRRPGQTIYNAGRPCTRQLDEARFGRPTWETPEQRKVDTSPTWRRPSHWRRRRVSQRAASSSGRSSGRDNHAAWNAACAHQVQPSTCSSSPSADLTRRASSPVHRRTLERSSSSAASNGTRFFYIFVTKETGKRIGLEVKSSDSMEMIKHKIEGQSSHR